MINLSRYRALLTTISMELPFSWTLGMCLYLLYQMSQWYFLHSSTDIWYSSETWQWWLYTVYSCQIQDSWILHGMQEARGITWVHFSAVLMEWASLHGSKNGWLFSKAWNIHLMPHNGVNSTQFSHVYNRVVMWQIPTWGEGGPGHCYGRCAGSSSVMTLRETLRGAFNGSQIHGIFKTVFLLTK